MRAGLLPHPACAKSPCGAPAGCLCQVPFMDTILGCSHKLLDKVRSHRPHGCLVVAHRLRCARPSARLTTRHARAHWLGELSFRVAVSVWTGRAGSCRRSRSSTPDPLSLRHLSSLSPPERRAHAAAAPFGGRRRAFGTTCSSRRSPSSRLHRRRPSALSARIHAFPTHPVPYPLAPLRPRELVLEAVQPAVAARLAGHGAKFLIAHKRGRRHQRRVPVVRARGRPPAPHSCWSRERWRPGSPVLVASCACPAQTG